MGTAICRAALLTGNIGLDFPLIRTLFELLLETISA